MAVQAFSINEVATCLGLTRFGVVWWIKAKGIECMETNNGRRFFTAAQLEAFKQKRSASRIKTLSI